MTTLEYSSFRRDITWACFKVGTEPTFQAILIGVGWPLGPSQLKNHEGHTFCFRRIVNCSPCVTCRGVCNRNYWRFILLPHSSSLILAAAVVDSYAHGWLPTWSTYHIAQLFAAWSVGVVNVPRISLQPRVAKYSTSQGQFWSAY